MKTKRLLVLLTMLMVILTACGGNTPDATETVAPVVDLEAQIAELEGYKVACMATVASQDEVITNLIDDGDACAEEYSFLEDAYNALLVSDPDPTPEPTAEPTEEPTDEPADDNSWRYVCGTVKMETGVYNISYDKKGRIRYNDEGHFIMKVVPRTEVAHYMKGETVCMYWDAFQVDNMRVTRVTGPRGRNDFIPTFRVDFVRPVNPNQ